MAPVATRQRALDLPHLAGRLVGVPLAISQGKLDAILAAVGPRFGLRPGAESLLPFEEESEDEQNENDAPAGIAVLRVHGSLVSRASGMAALSGLRSYRSIGLELDAALQSREVDGILLEIDSGGGEVQGLYDLADKILEARSAKPVYAVADENAFSAAYALAASAERVFLSRTAGVGSVGVLALHVDQSQADRADGLAYNYVQAGAKKVDGNPHEPLSDRARTDLQAEVDRVYGLFVEHVAKGRGMKPEAVRATEAGLYFGEDAVKAGLADQVGTGAEALSALVSEVERRKQSTNRLGAPGSRSQWAGRKS